MMKPLSRRTLLRGAAGAAVALPYLDAMRPARGALKFPKRLVIVFSSCGTVAPSWNPTGSESNFTLSPILKPLEAHKSDLVVLQGIDMITAKNQRGDNGHDKGMSHLLTCTKLRTLNGRNGLTGGPSVDQVVGQKIGTGTKFRTLELGVQAVGIEYIGLAARMCYAASGESIPPENNPATAYDRLFRDLQAPSAPTVDKLRARRQRVLDHVLEDYKRLALRLGREDRDRVDAHLEALAQTEEQLVGADDAANDLTANCAKPSREMAENIADSRQFPQIGSMQMNVLVAALRCDLSRVVTLQWNRAESDRRLTWLNTSNYHHALSHAGDSDEVAQKDLVKINAWYAEQFATLLSRMKAVKEGDGTLLDNSVVLWVNELGKGNNHSHDDVPFVLAGRAGGAVRTGRYLRYTNAPHNNLMVSVMNALDIDTASFGDPEVCTGALAGL